MAGSFGGFVTDEVVSGGCVTAGSVDGGTVVTDVKVVVSEVDEVSAPDDAESEPEQAANTATTRVRRTGVIHALGRVP